MDLSKYIRDVENFPKEGVLFKDITPLLLSPEATREALRQLVAQAEGLGVTKVAAVESRGFFFGSLIANELGVGYVPVRKKGKLPYETISMEYDLEYGTATIEMHKDSIKPGQKVLIVDDLIATGGTTEAMVKLIELLGGEVVGIVVMIELAGLEDRKRLEGYRLESAICYEGK